MRVHWLWMMAACGDRGEGDRRAGGDPGEVPIEPPVEVPPSVPLMGGTLEAVPALDAVVASLPERDQVVLLDMDGGDRITELPEGSVPFRLLVEEERVWVTLRGTGELALLEPASATVSWRVPVCAEPRGLDRIEDSVLVACASGELVQVDDAGEVVRSELLMPDLRDVLLEDGALFVSRFRSAEVLVLDPVSWALQHRASFVGGGMAYRMRPAPDRGVALLFQARHHRDLTSRAGGYAASGECGGPSQGSIGTVDPEGGVVQGGMFLGLSLPVDFVLTADGGLVIADGAEADQIAVSTFPFETALELQDACILSAAASIDSIGSLPSGLAVYDGEVVLHSTQPNHIASSHQGFGWQEDRWLTTERSFRLFHQDPGSGISCASCHPEGTDDGRVWRFTDLPEAPERRTMTLAGGVSQRAPFHWLGEHETERDLMFDTFVMRMGGGYVSDDDVSELFAWLDGIRPVRATVADAGAVARGEAVFEDAGCDSCHSGSQYTDNRVRSVRAQELVKVPTLLGLGLRERLMHDGCATSIEDRLQGDELCTGGTKHGDLSGRGPQEIADLAAFLRSL
jgi:hypothetical protein